ncbi:uncharacterized protein L3040_000437 [Drepanopeziza brunnea f. sp. 'multigermtubi']|uniref:uncharacterized protein n=1 Tax=Drepanopeziza brunnea f. sp. 'multigermtubi' TaxID=698441 RepID=UPI0023880AB6|nr:hypothetical protein L3040_000437 [Drepanopeziza brunnea f. sp. 'multigermtubi']
MFADSDLAPARHSELELTYLSPRIISRTRSTLRIATFTYDTASAQLPTPRVDPNANFSQKFNYRYGTGHTTYAKPTNVKALRSSPFPTGRILSCPQRPFIRARRSVSPPPTPAAARGNPSPHLRKQELSKSYNLTRASTGEGQYRRYYVLLHGRTYHRGPGISLRPTETTLHSAQTGAA